MRRLLKFTVGTNVTQVETADEPRWLAVGWQGDELVAWCEAEPVSAGTSVGFGYASRLVPVPTGGNVPDGGEYVGTAMHPTMLGGSPLVMHVYARGPFPEPTDT